jgi:hypothetical protein
MAVEEIRRVEKKAHPFLSHVNEIHAQVSNENYLSKRQSR